MSLAKPGLMDIFVTRPVLAVVISLVLVIAGLKAAQEIPVLEYPQIESSSLVISTAYIGASAEVVCFVSGGSTWGWPHGSSRAASSGCFSRCSSNPPVAKVRCR